MAILRIPVQGDRGKGWSWICVDMPCPHALYLSDSVGRILGTCGCSW